MTEAAPTLAKVRCNRPGSLGRALGGVEVRVVEGELWLRSSAITPVDSD